MIVARWFYKCDPVLPELDNAGRRFHKRQIYYDLAKLVNENPGLNGGQIALKLGRPVSQITLFICNLRKYCKALDVERSGFIRTPGLEEFLQLGANIFSSSRISAGRQNVLPLSRVLSIQT